MVQVTAVPDGTVDEGGVKLKSVIRTCPGLATTVKSAAAVGCAGGCVANGVSTVELGTAGRNSETVGFGPGVLVEEVTIAREAAAVAVTEAALGPPQPARRTATANTHHFN